MAALASDLKLIAAGRAPVKAYQTSSAPRKQKKTPRPEARPAVDDRTDEASAPASKMWVALVAMLVTMIGIGVWALFWGPLEDVGASLIEMMRGSGQRL
jgi:hypothetical protein